MEISPILLQQQLSALEPLLIGVVAAGIVHATWQTIRVRVRRPRFPRPSLIGSLVGGVGLAVALSGPALAAGRDRSRFFRIDSPSEAPPWSEPSGPPPPLPLGSITRGGHSSSPVHPAIHRRHARVEPLFARVEVNGSVPTARRVRTRNRIDRELSMLRHPSGKSSPGSVDSSPARHTVVAGDTLWDIAARTLRTDDLRRIARYWPRLHRTNRAVIGRDPNLLLPGQVLRLPREDDR